MENSPSYHANPSKLRGITMGQWIYISREKMAFAQDCNLYISNGDYTSDSMIANHEIGLGGGDLAYCVVKSVIRPSFIATSTRNECTRFNNSSSMQDTVSWIWCLIDKQSSK